MTLLWNDKDGGPESKGWIWGIEVKSLFSILLVKFERGTRPAYHSHAFHAVSWLVWGALHEIQRDGKHKLHYPSLRPILTPRHTFHQVHGLRVKSWVITFRGPWVAKWKEYIPATRQEITLTYGRKEI